MSYLKKARKLELELERWMVGKGRKDIILLKKRFLKDYFVCKKRRERSKDFYEISYAIEGAVLAKYAYETLKRGGLR